MGSLYRVGCGVAAVLSWQVHSSVIWAIMHGICSWLYVIYWAVR